jgi:very-short-patch-repair endonuclease/ribonuclease HI
MYIYETGNENYNLLKEFAQHQRKYPTEAESVLWSLLRQKSLNEKFRRQHVIGNYIADFVCLHKKLIIEIDGGYHLKEGQVIKDTQRTEWLENLGYQVIRFTNEEVLFNTANVMNDIQQILSNKALAEGATGNTLEAPSPFGEGRGGAPVANAWAVDAACSGNPGPMEYQAIDLQTGAQVFHFGPVHGTNNIGEFLAIVHALALMEKQGITGKTIYSDSYNAILWVRKKQCKTKLEHTPQTEPLYQIIRRAEQWLRTHAVTVPIIKWETQKWGEIPADFGRK